MDWRRFVLNNGNQLSFLIALVAASGSLYLSEILRYEPCKLCWIQRIFMYPLVLLFAVASIKKDYRIYRYALPLTIIGGGFSVYHYLMQKTPLFSEGGTCGPVPCTYDALDWFGFITVPFLALVAFVLIAILQLFLRKAAADE
ncbi:disulfide oxidoreductase [Paenibacillus senegalensis]|uniref:disulfide oxidoreductase n=1 Tax=Paenibacillus senegalensis TaxID=1465766 RepID=UPI00028998DB|nr:disulfide oxidoreductase [Paenibacillus senegalensis]